MVTDKQIQAVLNALHHLIDRTPDREERRLDYLFALGDGYYSIGTARKMGRKLRENHDHHNSERQ